MRAGLADEQGRYHACDGRGLHGPAASSHINLESRNLLGKEGRKEMNKYHLSVSLTGHGEWSQVEGAIEHRHLTPPELIQVWSKRCALGCVSFMLVDLVVRVM